MLPPKDMNTKCLRCGEALEEDQRICGVCGADREVEMKIAAELRPAVAALRRWLAIVGALFLALGLILYSHYGSALSTVDLVFPFAIAGALFVLCLVAPAFPLLASVVAICLFLAHWGLAVIQDPWAAFAPGLALVLRVFSLVILLDGTRAGYKAHVARRRAAAEFPSAKAHFKQAP